MWRCEMETKRIFITVVIVLFLSACGVLSSGRPTLNPTITPTGESLAQVSATIQVAGFSLTTATPTQAPPTFTNPPPSATSTPEIGIGTASGLEKYKYTVQVGSPVSMPNWGHPESKCDWLGIAGLVFDLESKPVMGIVVEAGGTLGDNPVFGLSITGLADIYGVGGYEIVLANHTIASTGTVWVQLYNLDGKPLSKKIFIDTSDKCTQNLITLNFVEGLSERVVDTYFPWFGKDYRVP
jgi:hypothetical protein